MKVNSQKGLLIVLVCAFVCFNCLGQFAWFKSYEGADYTSLAASSFDKQSNSVLSVGNFSNGITLSGQTISGFGSFIVKHSLEGDVIWHKVIRYSEPSFYHLGYVKTDGQGNIYVVTQSPQWTRIDDTTITFDGQPNSLLVKFNAQGDLMWVKKFRHVQELFRMDVNASGHVAITGHFFNSITIDHITLHAPFSTFVTLFNSDGDLLWANGLSSANAFTNWPVALALDEESNFYFCGRYTGPLEVGSVQLANQGSANYNLFYAKFNSHGNVEWVTQGQRKIPSIYEPPAPPGGMLTEIGDMVVDTQGNLFMCGVFYNELSVDGKTVTSAMEETLMHNLFTIRLNSQGDVDWLVPDLLESNGYAMTAENIALHNNTVIMSGIYQYEPYFRTLSKAGLIIRERTTLPLIGDIGNGMTIDNNGDVYLSGRYRESFSSENKFKGYLLKVGWTASIVDAPDLVCSNGILHAVASSNDTALHYEWEITYNGTSKKFITTNSHELQIATAQFMPTTHLSIRVRILTSEGLSGYSTTRIIEVIQPNNNIPVIKRRICNELTATGGSFFKWYLNDEIMGQYSPGTGSIIATVPGNYYVIQEHACGNEKSNVIAFEPFDVNSLFVPNIITPNGDAINENFILDQQLTSAALPISSRWGNVVYRTDEYQNDWSGEQVANGVYYYVITHQCLQKPLKGTLTVIR